MGRGSEVKNFAKIYFFAFLVVFFFAAFFVVFFAAFFVAFFFAMLLLLEFVAFTYDHNVIRRLPC